MPDLFAKFPSPDDIEDLREFVNAVESRLTVVHAGKLVEDFIILALRVGYLMDEVKKYDTPQMGHAFSVTALVKLFKFVKENESAIKGLMTIGETGNVFLYDHNHD